MDAQQRAVKKYKKKNIKKYCLELNYKTDSELIEKLENVPNKQGYLKELIVKDMKEGKGNEERNEKIHFMVSK